MKKHLTGIFLLLLLCSSAYGQANPPTTVVGVTQEFCTTPTVTASSAYTTGNVVGGLITITPFRSTQTGAAYQSGVLQSLRLTVASVQTAEFDIYQLSANPSSSTWTDKAAPAINAADVTKVLPPIKLTSASSGLGTHTVYGADAIGRARQSATTSDYFVITTVGTPTFSLTTGVQFCATYLLD